jgi:tRNA dimethylallyltransferase
MDEREGIPHHVMNHVTWDEEYFIHRFSKEAAKAIGDIHSRGKLPIIVGGTHYYLNSLLFNNKTITGEKIGDASMQLTPEQQEILDGSSETVLELLRKCDPQVAEKFHPNDTRRIRRALEIYYTTNKQASHHYNSQQEQFKSQSALKYNTLLFWLFAQKPQLDKRLDDRVDQMLSKGGMQEIQELHECYKQHPQKPDLERGIWQVIGFKEFLPWLESGQQDDKLLKECVESMKAHTRQYAKKQVKWIKGLLASDLKKEEQHDYIHGGRLYVLDATDLYHWRKNVSERGISITDEFLLGHSTIPQTPATLSILLPQEEQGDKTTQWKHITCPVCHNPDDSPLIIVGDRQYDIHIRSKRHRSNLNRGKRRRDYEEWLAKKGKTTETST